MSIGRILFLAIFLFSASSILAGGSLVEKITYESMPDTSLSGIGNIPESRQLKADYQNQLLTLLNGFQDRDASFKTLEEKLLAMTVPAEYRDLHFQLTSAFGELSRSKADKPEIKEKLKNLLDVYSWLSAQLSVFIINNF